MEPARFNEYRPSATVFETVNAMREWEVLGAKCAKCGHISWLDKAKIVRRYGDQYLNNLADKLVCQCGNKTGNAVLIGTLGRD